MSFKINPNVATLQGAAVACGDPNMLSKWSTLYGQGQDADREAIRRFEAELKQMPRRNNLDSGLPREHRGLTLRDRQPRETDLDRANREVAETLDFYNSPYRKGR